MQILLAIIFAAAVGTGLHFLIPRRATRGVALAPILAAAVGAVAWTALTWAGLGPDNPWIWVISVIAPVVVTVPIVTVLSTYRARHDERERARLRII